MVAMIFEWHLARSIARQLTFPFPSPSNSDTRTTLDFTAGDKHLAQRAPKRFRSQADVDGEGSGNVQKKKRRLRLDLITSRLSRPFATPTTHIVGRRTSKFAIGARQKVWCRDLLRKAAIMNGIRMMHASASGARIAHPSDTHPISKWNQAYHTDINTVNERNNRLPPTALQKYSNVHTPQAPSPLSLPNHDECDDPDGIYDDQDWEDLDTDIENMGSVNSDFDMREPVDSIGEDCEFLTP